MKTAMQELIDDIQQAFQGQWGVYLNSEKFAPYLEKEKEQIINGHWAGWQDAYDYLREDNNDKARQAEEYYEETYNQNK
jgi:hypothetical protein